MIAGNEIPELVELVDPASLKVHAPTSAIFLCGGQEDVTAPKPLSLRDAYLRVHHKSTLRKYDVRLAEEVNPYFPKGKYTDLLTFESDIAQIFELVVLFSESIGSAAELGAFTMYGEIAKRLLIVIDDKNYNSNSFVKLGPILRLENDHGEESVCVLNTEDIGILNIRDVSNIDLEKFEGFMVAAIKKRLSVTPNPATFAKANAGHVIKLIAGLIQHYGAMTLDEIVWALTRLGINRDSTDDVHNYLLCAEFIGWIRKDKRGFATYFADSSKKVALHYELIPDYQKIDKSRWRSDIAEYWKQHDPNRFNAINAARAIAK